MKIGIVCNTFGNALYRGGAEVQVENTMQAINRIDGVSAEVITHATRNIEQFDIVHFFQSSYWYTYLAEALVERRIPYVVSSIYFTERSMWKTSIMFKTFRLLPARLKNAIIHGKILYLWDNAACIFPNTDEEAALLRRIVPNVPIDVIPNGLNLDTMPEVSADMFFNAYPQLEVLRNQKFVLNVGRMETRKNQKNLVLACMKLNVPIVHIGLTSQAQYWSEVQSLQYDKFFHIDPIYDNPQLLYSAYAACHVFALPSTLETPGIAAMEAMYYNKPVVITKFGGTKFYFKDKATYADWRSVDEIARGIQKYWDKPSPCPSLRSVVQEYSWDKIAQQYVVFFNDIIGKIK